MKREEQIREAAKKTTGLFSYRNGYSTAEDAFVAGAEWADANQPSPWISVEERLPYINSNSYSDCVLTIDENQNIVVAFFSFYRHEWIRADREGDIDDSIIQNDITHWMPIPELPKEEKENKRV